MQNDRYEIEAVAGEGGMGVVYRARDRRTGRTVAIKMMHKSGERERSIMRREAQIIADIAHPGVITYIEQGESKDGVLFVVLEWLDGEDLEVILSKRGKLSVDETLNLAEQLAETLAAVHSRGILHRDIKPSNIFVIDRDGQLKTKLIDFGIAHQKSLQTVSPIVPKGKAAMIGTLGYMAPEQARGEQKLTPGADIFSLGCVLFRCLAGEGPFEGAHEIAILAKILFDETPQLRSLRPDVPPQVEALIAAMLNKSPEGRPKSAERLSQMLREVRASLADPFKEETIVEHHPGAAQSLTEREQQLFCVLLLQREEVERPKTLAPPTIAMAEHTLAESESIVLERTQNLPPATLLLQEEAQHTNNTYPKALRVLQSEVKQESERFGGRTEGLADGSALVFFVGEVATDMALRAARCAKALQKRFPGRNIALATGRAEVTARWPVGEVIERAVALISSEKKSIVLDEATAGLVSARFSLRRTPHALILEGENDAAISTRTLLGKRTPCVGREEELSFLLHQYETCISHHQAGCTLITAAAGLGKSRLREEFVARLSRHPTRPRVLVGFGDEEHREEPYGVLAAVLRRDCGLTESAPAAENQRRFLARVGRYLPAKGAAHTTAFLGELLGLGIINESAPLVEAARQDPVLLGDHLRRAFETWLSAETQERPTLLLIEDWHWCDTATVMLLRSLSERLAKHRLFLLLFARPEALEKNKINGHHLALSPLSQDAANALIAHILGEGEPRARELWERSEGNPFYLEELIRAAAQRLTDFPQTMLAMVQARLSALPEEERRALRAASIFGQRFWARGVEALLGAPTSVWSSLEQAELIERTEGKFPGEDQFQFRHALLREGAYALLTDEDKEIGHRIVGEWLSHSKESEATLLAEHFTKGRLPERAIECFVVASESAIAGNDLEGAIALVHRGVDLGAKGEALGALLSLEAIALNWRAEFVAASGCIKRALQLLKKGGELWCRAAAEAVVAFGRSGEIVALVALGDELLRLGQSYQGERFLTAVARSVGRLILSGQGKIANELLSLGESLAKSSNSISSKAWIEVARAANSILRGDLSRYLSHMKLSVSLFESLGDQRNACMQNVDVSFAQILLGDYQAAYETCANVASVASQMGLLRVEALNYLYWAQALHGLNHWQEGIAITRTAIETLHQQRDTQTEGAAYTELARLLQRTGASDDEVEQPLQRALTLMTPQYPFRPRALSVLAQLRRAQGKLDEALQLSEAALALIKEGRDFVEVFVRYTHVEVLDELGRREEARAALHTAAQKLLARANRIEDEPMRRSFLTNVPENRALLAMAAAWGAL